MGPDMKLCTVENHSVWVCGFGVTLGNGVLLPAQARMLARALELAADTADAEADAALARREG